LAQAIDAYWDLHEKFVKNTSDKMLEMATMDIDELYWEVDVAPQSTKCKQHTLMTGP